MMMLRRLQRLECQHYGVAVDVALQQRERAIRSLQLLLRFDPAPAGEFATLLNKGHRLAEAGQVLTSKECEEGRRLGERLTKSLRAAQIASGQEPDGGTFPFPYAPGRVQSERLPAAAGDYE